MFDLDIEGERCFKKVEIDEGTLNEFLKPKFQNSNWSTSISIKWLDDHWRFVMLLVKEYITCEGRYCHVCRFHMCFLLHIVGEIKMNLSFFLLKSLMKMSRKVQKYFASAKTSLAHHGLITTRVYDELYRNQITEKVFLIDAGFDMKEDMERKNMQKKKKTPTSTTKKSLKKRDPATTKAQVSDSKPQVKLTYVRRVTRSKAAKVLNSEMADHKVLKKKYKGIKGDICVTKIKIDT